jgi:hypothetical protein
MIVLFPPVTSPLTTSPAINAVARQKEARKPIESPEYRYFLPDSS